MQNKKQKAPIQYYIGETLVTETNPSHGALCFFYQTFFGRIIKKLLNKRWLARLAGAYYSSSLSKRQIKPFISLYNIAMDEYERPAEKYTSFNDFFTRKLRPGTRTIDTRPNALISPVDSKLFVFPVITPEMTFFVKKQPFDLAKFLGDPSHAKLYEHGSMFIFRLAPYDYHRIHFPATGRPTPPKGIHGSFESVNPIVFKSGVQPLTQNERHIVLLDTQTQGIITLVSVGAMFVGSIVETFTPNNVVERGSELGYFAFGGSTVVMLCQEGAARPKNIFIQHSLQGYETGVKMGEAVTE